MSFSHIAWEFFKNSNRNSRRIQVGKIPSFTFYDQKSETSDLLFNTSLLIDENSISSSSFFSFGSLCTPKYPMAGTSATIFEWEDSGNGFLRGGHRSLRFPSDTAHSFVQWGQNLFVVAF